MKSLVPFLIIIPFQLMAAQKPSMTSMWLDLFFLIAVVISLKVTDIPNQQKLIIFVVYIFAGIVTKSIWFPVILWLAMWYYFKNQLK